MLRRDARRRGIVSLRPYQLGQACDWSTTACVLALFTDFAEAYQLDPIVLLAQAYIDSSYTEQDLRADRRAADWEGTAYPAHWGQAEIEGLLESLHEENYHALATVVGNIADERIECTFSAAEADPGAEMGMKM